MPIETHLSQFVTLFVVVDPVGIAPIFLAVTEGLPADLRLRVGARACLIAGLVLAGFALGGNWLLAELGISISAFRIAGGLLLFATAFDMVLGSRRDREAKTAERAIDEHVRHLAAFPLAVPLMAGPGAITASVLLSGQSAHDPVALAALIATIAAVMVICGVAFRFASWIAWRLGITGNVVVSRLLGVLLAALAVQYVLDGINVAIAAR
jgi:multiple antibiotic resistance protein